MHCILYLIVLSIKYSFSDGKQDNMSTDKIALVTGYTGETGKALVKELISNNQFKKIILVGRRKVDYTDNKYLEKTEQREIDFDKIDDHAEAFGGADVHFSCLGTTRARLAKQQGCKHFHLVSSQGANENSYFLYPQVKGQSEAAITKMSFDRLSIYRPAVLMVDRAESRTLERLARTILSYTIQRIAPEWLTTPIDVLGRAMCLNSFTKDRPNVEILDNHAIFRLAEQQSNSESDQSKTTNEL
ncbi:unnamed protein product [Rotaria magnacalcarata]